MLDITHHCCNIMTSIAYITTKSSPIRYSGFRTKTHVHMFDFASRLLVAPSNKVSKPLSKDNSWLARDKLLLVKDRLQLVEPWVKVKQLLEDFKVRLCC